jgi:S1-C subfamily serine protease
MNHQNELFPIDNSEDGPVHFISNIVDDPITSQHTPSNPSPPPAMARVSLVGRWFWIVTMVCTILAMRFVVPQFIEEFQYAMTRGKLRAEYEVASEVLATAPLEGLSQAYRSVSRKIAPSLVHISVETPNNLSERMAFLPGHRMLHKGQGSGVIVDESGFIMTNYHVVKGASSIEVGLSDGRIVPGHLVGVDELTDLAVVKVDADNLIAAQWGNSDDLAVGSLVWAAGSPFGLRSSVTFGILSAKNRAGVAGTPYQDFLQTDAAVNPGNSGGPLVDVHGNVIGINTAIVGEAYQGISFAVPSSVAKDVYSRIKEGGHVPRGWLGVQMAEVDDLVADRMELQDTDGVLVEKVVGRNSPAARGGIKPGDIIRRWNGETIVNRSTLSRLVAKTQVGAEATILVLRGGKPQLLTIRVAERPQLPL